MKVLAIIVATNYLIKVAQHLNCISTNNQTMSWLHALSGPKYTI
ncbi:hypothetical protein QUA82_03820 [Microcoleus sp. F8-D3]